MTAKVLMLGPGDRIVGGISTLVETLVPALDQQVDMLYFPTVRHRPLKKSGKISFRNIILVLCQYARFFNALYSFRPQIIHLHTSQGIAWLKDTFYVLAGKTHRCDVVLHVHAAEFDELYAKKGRFMKYYTRVVMGLADAVIAVSEEWAKRLADIVSAKKVFTFKNCIAVDAIPIHSVHPQGDETRALFLGSVGPRKGAFDLLEAMGHLKFKGCAIQAWVAGDEERQGDMLEAKVRLEELKLGDSYQLLGIVRGVKKAKLLSQANVFVLPSYDEGLPIAILEAMAAGLAVVSTPVGGIPEVVKDSYNGFLVNPGDVEALTEKLAILASDPNLRAVMGQRSREIVESELDVISYAKKLVSLYESLIGPRED